MQAKRKLIFPKANRLSKANRQTQFNNEHLCSYDFIDKDNSQLISIWYANHYPRQFHIRLS